MSPEKAYLLGEYFYQRANIFHIYFIPETQRSFNFTNHVTTR